MPNHNAAPLPDEGAGKTNRKTPKPRGQMSDAWSTVAFLTLSGGFQDAYTFFTRGRVFANAQTGNMVLLGLRLSEGRWHEALRYLIPISAFAAWVFLSDWMQRKWKQSRAIHWRKLVLGL